jgi:hypothetical protein
MCQSLQGYFLASADCQFGFRLPLLELGLLEMLQVSLMLADDVESFAELVIVSSIEQYIVSHLFPKIYCHKEIPNLPPFRSSVSSLVQRIGIMRAVFIVELARVNTA